jgi:tRNA pseudouridine55 synthase
VAKTRGILRDEYLKKSGEKRKVKVGHTGTLDPQATGLMIIVVGDYCKKASEFSKLDKTYEVSMILGQGSSTGDIEGEITEGPEITASKDQIIDVLIGFLGESMQTPPIYSAIKINGQRAYKLARDGKEVNIEPRKINIYDIKLTDYSYPNLSFVVSVSSGTYIRSLAEDIAKKLGTLGHLTSLRRTVVGNYSVEQAIKIENITNTSIITP